MIDNFKSPTIHPLPQVLCPMQNCSYDITKLFNTQRSAIFNIITRSYATKLTLVERNRYSGTTAKAKDAMKSHLAGTSYQEFDMKCPGCKKRLYFKINTLTGEVLHTDNTPLKTELLLPTPVEAKTSIEYDSITQLAIDRYPTGDCQPMQLDAA